MWWQIIPPSAIMVGCACVQFLSPGIIHYVLTGVPTMRGLTENTYIEIPSRLAFRRDFYNTGTFYSTRGLENIPDDD